MWTDGRKDGRTEGHEEANSRVVAFMRTRPKLAVRFFPLHTTCLFVYLEAETTLLELWTAGVRLPAETRDPRPTLGPIQPPVQWVGWPGREAAHTTRVLTRLRFTWSMPPVCRPAELSRYSDLLQAGRFGDRIPVGWEIFGACQHRSWGPPSLLYNGYRVIPGGRAAGVWRWPPTLNLAPRLKKEYSYTSTPLMGASGFLHGFISPTEINLLLPLCSSFISHPDHIVNGFHGTESYNIQYWQNRPDFNGRRKFHDLWHYCLLDDVTRCVRWVP